MDRKEQAEKFLGLFKGNTRSFGQYRPDKEPPMWTIKDEPVTIKHALNHFDGKIGLGRVPILDDDTCWWGAVDIDAHGSAEDIDLKSLAMEIERNNFPLIPCRSKSGGVHLYLFLSQPVLASKVQQMLKFWAGALGYGGSEIFPKQVSLKSTKGNPPLGNWINLPCFDAESTDRYLFKYGKSVGLDTFLKAAEANRVNAEDLEVSAVHDHSEAPPCVQQIIKGFAKKGTRNEALYAIGVYLKKRDGDDFEDSGADLAAEVFDPPLSTAEVKRTLASVAVGNYTYKCGQSPCMDFCNRQVCYTRKYGIEPRDSDGRPLGDIFVNLRRYESDPVVWEIDIHGHSVKLSTVQLMDARLVRNAAMEYAAILLQPMTAKQWEPLLFNLNESLQTFAVPDDASPSGRVRHKLMEFIRRCDLSITGKPQDLFHGNPVTLQIDGEHVVAFQGIDFIDFLRQTRTDELKQAQVWMAVQSLGVRHKNIQVKGRELEVWYKEIDAESDEVDIEVPDYAPEY